MTSPMAKMPGTLVWKSWSTLTKPRLSISTPTVSSPSPSVYGPPADRDQHHVHLQGLGVAALHRLDGEADAGFGLLGAGDLARQLEGQSLFLEGAQHLLGDLAVHAGEDLVEELDHRHLGAEPPPHRSELDADVAAADHHHRLRHLGQRQRPGGADDPFLVDLDPRQRRHVGTGGDQDVLGLERSGLAAVGRRHRHLVGGGDRSRSDQVVDLVLLEQELDALGEVADDAFLALHHRRQVDLQARDLDPVRRRTPRPRPRSGATTAATPSTGCSRR